MACSGYCFIVWISSGDALRLGIHGSAGGRSGRENLRVGCMKAMIRESPYDTYHPLFALEHARKLVE